PVNHERVEFFKKQLQTRIAKLLTKIHKLPEVKRFHQSGKLFQPTSSPQTKKILTSIMRLEVEGADEKVLNKIDHPFAKLTLRYRQASKLLSTYVEPFTIDSPLIYPDGMLHPVYHTSSTRTNRTSADEPNIQ